MKTSQSQCLAVLALLSSVASAVPMVWPVRARAAEAQSYSVVPVDGGSSTPASSAPLATKTVTDAITEVQTTTQVQTATLLSTIIASASNSPASIQTQVIPQTVTLATTVVHTATPSAETPATATATATVTVEPGVISVPFDNGEWHTTYYFRSTVAPSADVQAAAITPSPSSNVSSSIATPTTTMDPGQWAAWAEIGTGQ
ncbi:hypothetical protein LTR70_009331 [Exophiala xenobiotica]|uniref:Uncharacterized protein n=1 Tax=Lithohypha guttulata TaxID=1690604 RepID=A0ABR0K083_9EURO|nr:hypothetical protein LTR24_008341 [Lithohypha guttulata]KAK5310646.1 hypothetical protein LTR70_009331 [Exophiala xenobiotica]